MQNRLTHYKVPSLAALILAIPFSFYLLNAADSAPIDPTSKVYEQSLLYPLEESLDTLKNPSASPPSKTPSTKEEEKLFYPNLFQNDLFAPSSAVENAPVSPVYGNRTNAPVSPIETQTQIPATYQKANTPVTNPTTILSPNQTTPNATNAVERTPSQVNSTQPIQAPQGISVQPNSQTNGNSAPTGNGQANGNGAATGNGASNRPSELNPTPPQVTIQRNNTPNSQKTVLINFNNVAITEYIRFISRISNKNFVFDENDLQFTVTIVSEEPTTIENVMTALLQELRIHDLDLIEQGNTLIIHKNSKVSAVAKVVTEDTRREEFENNDLITRVFKLNTLEASRAAVLLKPMVSATALVEVLKETNTLIITDLTYNVDEIAELLRSLDSPHGGLLIGQYVVTAEQPELLIATAQKILAPLAQGQKITFIPHKSANSIFVIANPYLVERSLAILKYLDQSTSTSQILNPRDLNFVQPGTGRWILDKNGNWQFIPGDGIKGNTPPNGVWKLDDQGNWYFDPNGTTGPDTLTGPDGKWIRDKDGNWIFQLNPGKSISPQRITRKEVNASELPVGHIERTQFSMYKLQYRKGGQIALALGRIGESLLAGGGGTNADLLHAINSVQWIEASNALIFTGTPDALKKIKELIADIDVPLRQVLLEMLILETDITDSLDFSTNVASAFGGGNTSGAEAFLSGTSTLPAGLATSGIGVIPNAVNTQVTNQLPGFVLGIIGQTITHNGTEYATLGGLVRALSARSCKKIIMNPKILTEDNSPAEIFVGLNTQFPTQSIANNFGTTITQNFEFRDVGTTLKVTPIIGNNDIVTLLIQEEVSAIISGGTTSGTTNTVIGPTTSINRTTTRVHVPNRFFLILSGMLKDEAQRDRTQVPCLGSIPLIGGVFSDKQITDTKQNVMIFVHPIIIDTEEEMDNITKHNQDIYRMKNRTPKTWVWETDEAMDFLNIIDTDNRDGSRDCY